MLGNAINRIWKITSALQNFSRSRRIVHLLCDESRRVLCITLINLLFSCLRFFWSLSVSLHFVSIPIFFPLIIFHCRSISRFFFRSSNFLYQFIFSSLIKNISFLVESLNLYIPVSHFLSLYQFNTVYDTHIFARMHLHLFCTAHTCTVWVDISYLNCPYSLI